MEIAGFEWAGLQSNGSADPMSYNINGSSTQEDEDPAMDILHPFFLNACVLQWMISRQDKGPPSPHG